MLLTPDVARPAVPAVAAPVSTPLTSMTVPYDDSSQEEDDAPTRVFYKQGSFPLDTLPELYRASTKERATTQQPTKKIYVRDFDVGDGVPPVFHDILDRAGINAGSSTVKRGSDLSSSAEPESKSTVMEITHNWTQQIRDNEFIATINVLERSSTQNTQSDGHIVWVHVEDQLPSLDRLEGLFQKHLAKRIQPFVRETALSILNKVRTTHERKLVSGTLGKFLVPGVVRYSARTLGTDNEDHPCLFFSFPYLALGRFQTVASNIQNTHNIRKSWFWTQVDAHTERMSQIRSVTAHHGAGDVEGQKNEIEMGLQSAHHYMATNNTNKSMPEIMQHPPRTLLQSKYRLESTRIRDKSQAIFSLTASQTRECITKSPKGSENDVKKAQSNPSSTNPGAHLDKDLNVKYKRDKVYIPQLWSLSLTGDIMLTTGPISLDDLCGSDLVRGKPKATSSQLKHSVVRFILSNSVGSDDVFIYPAERCEWYFGLLNKQRKVENILDRQKVRQRHISGNVHDTFRYTLTYRENRQSNFQEVNCDNWLTIQTKHDTSQLDLLLKDNRVPKIDINGESSDTDVVSRSTSPGGDSRTDLHQRSLSDGSQPARRTPLRTLLAVSSPPRGRSAGSSTRSISPASERIAWPQQFTAFFEWPFRTDLAITEARIRGAQERVDVWLAATHSSILKSHRLDLDDKLQHHHKSRTEDHEQRLFKRIEPQCFETVEQMIKNSDAIQAASSSTTVSEVTQRVFSKSMQLLKLFTPIQDAKITVHNNEASQSTKCIWTYWGLVKRLLECLRENKLRGEETDQLLSDLREIFNFAESLHKGSCKNVKDKKGVTTVCVVESTIIFQPIPDAFRYLFEYFFTVVLYVSGKDPAKSNTFVQARSKAYKALMVSLNRAERSLIHSGDESRYKKSLGPVVTPEGITILLLRRLSRGVYRDGSVNLIDIFERVVERLANKVENSASRLVLLEINRVAEEIDIILDTFKQQKNFLDVYKGYLDPRVVEEILKKSSPKQVTSSTKRFMRFEYEETGIGLVTTDIDERIKDCEELQSRVQRLTEQNLQLVESGQDAINQKLMLFTLVTVIFSPLSFVASFYGMNVKGVDNMHYTIGSFWTVAAPLTILLLIFSIGYLYASSVRYIWWKVRQWWRKNSAGFGRDSLDQD